MYEQGNPYLQDWTTGRLCELRQAAATAQQLRSSKGVGAAWWTRAANELGRALVATGTRLELLANR